MKVLVISPHADDETLGAGGTILRYKNENKQVYWLNITDIKEQYGYSKDLSIQRGHQIKKVIECYKLDGFYNLGLEPAALDKYTIGVLVQKISNIINEIQPHTIIIPYRYDVHTDHKIVYDSVYSVTKVFRYPFVKRVLSMEILSETDFSSSENGFIPNYFVDITPYLEEKINIMKIYESELGEHPFPRSEENIRALAVFRGASSGVKYAEAFRMIKCIE